MNNDPNADPDLMTDDGGESPKKLPAIQDPNDPLSKQAAGLTEHQVRIGVLPTKGNPAPWVPDASVPDPATDWFPATHAESLALLKAATDKAADTPRDRNEKRKLITALSRHVHKLQQGLPQANYTADHMALEKMRFHDQPLFDQFRLEDLAAKNPAVAALIASHHQIA